MESVVSPSVAWRPGSLRRISPDAVRAWALAGTVVLYLSVDGGGYDLIVRSQVAIVVWWIVLIGAAWGLLPVTRLTRDGLGGARPVRRVRRLDCAGRHVVAELGAQPRRSSHGSPAISAFCCSGSRSIANATGRCGTPSTLWRRPWSPVACLALASRLRPDLFPAAHQTASYLPGTEGRLGWPLNYWNALAALLALGLPLLLSIATSARTLWAQSAAAAAIPVVTLCCYLTFSRGGAVAAGAGLLAFFLFSPDRVEKLATALVTAAGSAVLVLAADHRAAIEQGLTNAAARHQGDTLLVAVLLVCAGVALAQAGVGLAVRHGTPPRWLTVHPGPRADAAVSAVALVPRRWRCLPGPRGASHTPGRTSSTRARRRFSRTRSRASAPPAATAATTTGRLRSTRPAGTSQRLRRGHLPAAVDPAGAVLQLRPERALAVPGDARGDRHRRARPAGGVPAGGAGGGGQAVHPGTL